MSCSTICLRVQRLLLTLKRTLLMLVPATLIILSIRLSRRSPSRPRRRKLLLNELDSLAASLGRRSWTLENEVGVIASRVMKSRPTPTFPLFEEPWNLMTLLIQTMLWKLSSRKMIYPDRPFYVPYLTLITASFLSTNFSLPSLAKYTPACPCRIE